MYCIKCGVEMADGEVKCPLCQTVVVHPDFMGQKKDELYPSANIPTQKGRSKLLQAVFVAVFLLPVVLVLLSDLQINGTITWSGYVVGSLLVGYTAFFLPLWFRKPNPVIFIPCDFVAAGGFLFYISLRVGGDWFWTLGLPMLASFAILFCAVVTLMKYLYCARYFIFGGAFISLGGIILLCEFLIAYTFKGISFIGWSLYPLVSFAILGGLLIFLGICRSARESMERKFFI